jgi:hypothetical protein
MQYGRGHELRDLAQAEQHISEGSEHIEWQRGVVDILERISTCVEATEGARALLTIFLKEQAQREQDRDRSASAWIPTPLQQYRLHRGPIRRPTSKSRSIANRKANSLVKREQDGQVCARFDGGVAPPSTVPLEQPQPVDHRTDLELPVQREQDGDQVRASLAGGDVESSSTAPVG